MSAWYCVVEVELLDYAVLILRFLELRLWPPKVGVSFLIFSCGRLADRQICWLFLIASSTKVDSVTLHNAINPSHYFLTAAVQTFSCPSRRMCHIRFGLQSCRPIIYLLLLGFFLDFLGLLIVLRAIDLLHRSHIFIILLNQLLFFLEVGL